ncbi:MAG: Asp23/Gls24 family envelope stress response protein [Clostridiaceae bacterium]|nr:Asp23/Gls24 family envelope stress response protein [Clostridiaceae bacterium]
MKILTERGMIDISQDVVAGIVSECANNCFGIRGMAYTNKTDGLVHLLKRDAFKKGVRITVRDSAVSIELHIIVRHGINIAATGNSIISEIRYKVEKLTGVTVDNVTLCVDGIMTD